LQYGKTKHEILFQFEHYGATYLRSIGSVEHIVYTDLSFLRKILLLR